MLRIIFSQPASASTARKAISALTPAPPIRRSAPAPPRRPLPYADRLEPAQEVARRRELHVVGTQAKEKAIARREVELAHIKNGMRKARQAAQGEHAGYAGESRDEDRELEGHRNEHRPAMRRPPAGIDWIGDHRRVPLHEVAADAADEPTAEHDRRHPVALHARRLGEPFDREWRIRLDAHVPGFARLARGLEQPLRARKLGKHAVELHAVFSSWTSFLIS